MNTMETAKTALEQGDFHCAIAHQGKVIFTNQEAGVASLLEYCHHHGQGYPGAALAHRGVGRAEALLAQFCGFGRVYAAQISQSALSQLEQAGIPVEYDELVQFLQDPHHQNGQGGLCSVEQLAADIADPREMLTRLEQFMAGSDSAPC